MNDTIADIVKGLPPFPSVRKTLEQMTATADIIVVSATPNEALEHVASCKGIAMERLTIPSQRRYLSYFSSVMEGVR